MFSWCHLSRTLEDANHHPSVLWSYQFMEEESVKNHGRKVMKKLRKIFGSQNYSKGLTRSQQNQFAQTMGELLLSGFSLQESLYLLLTIRSFPPVILANIQHQLKEGQAFSEVLSQIGYGAEQLVQIELAERHGNLPTTLLEIAKQFRLVEGFRNDLKKLLAYPMLLLTFC